MKAKNNHLEGKRFIFFQIGLAIALLFSILAFEWKNFITLPSIEHTETYTFYDDNPTPRVLAVKKEYAKPKKTTSQTPDITDEIEPIIEELKPMDVGIEDPDTDPIDVDLPDEFDIDPLPLGAVQNKPVFPGCESETTEAGRAECFMKMMKQHVSKRFTYPEISKTRNSQGRVMVYFIIEKDGTVSNVSISKSVDEHIDREAERVIQDLPVFIPAKNRGRPVRMSFYMPIDARIGY